MRKTRAPLPKPVDAIPAGKELGGFGRDFALTFRDELVKRFLRPAPAVPAKATE